MILYRTTDGPFVEHEGRFTGLDEEWDAIFNRRGLAASLRAAARAPGSTRRLPRGASLLPPIESQEVWAAGVTYARSRAARMSESKNAGGGSFYDRVYRAHRPELFFKATPHRVVGQGAAMRLRRDSRWMVPEPELTLAVNSRGRIFGCTVGNDLSCRDIEGENPLYLPQAKTFRGCAAIGPGILVASGPLPRDTRIAMTIRRGGRLVFSGATELARMRKPLGRLVEYLFRDNAFPLGCFLMTGTGVVPPEGFGLRRGDEVRITIRPIGTLVNTMG
ncbi:MAG: Fumarylacetoacetate hydrolase family protein [Acidobacteria bacterium]|nr:Fumarylacetoacetate hydrolase family protein [Acidobacteriota bacterium]